MYGLELLNQSNLILLIRFLQINYQEKHDVNYYENIAIYVHLKDKKDGLMCVHLWICSAEPKPLNFILEVENYDLTVQRCLKCQVALLLLWICSIGSGTSIVRVITVLKISF